MWHQISPNIRVRQIHLSIFENLLQVVWILPTNTHLMRLFPKSLVSPTLEWFYSLQKGIKSWNELIEKIIRNYTYNIDIDTSITNLCTLAQEDVRETFILFFQKWRGIVSHCHIDILEKEKIDMFVQTLLGPLKHGLQDHYCTTFTDLVKHGVQVEKAHIIEGRLKYGPKNTNTSPPIDKKKYWVKNKHVTNDGVVDTKVFNAMGPMLTLKGAQLQNTKMTIQTHASNVVQKNQNNQGNQNNQNPRQPQQPRQFSRSHTYTPLGDPIEEFLKKLLQNGVITLQDPKPYDPRKFKPSCWDNNISFDYHRVKGHKTSSYQQLKNIVQDLIKNHTIEIGGPQFASNNPLPYHTQEPTTIPCF